MIDGPSVLGRRHDRRARAVAEQDAGRAVLVVDDARHDVGADDERVLVRAGRHELAGRRQRVGEGRAGARSGRSPTRGARRSSCWSRHAVLGNIMSGVTVPTTMTPMSSGVSPALLDRLERRLLAQVRRRHARIDDVPLADAGPLEIHSSVVSTIFSRSALVSSARRHVGRQRRDRPPPHRRAVLKTTHLAVDRFTTVVNPFPGQSSPK